MNVRLFRVFRAHDYGQGNKSPQASLPQADNGRWLKPTVTETCIITTEPQGQAARGIERLTGQYPSNTNDYGNQIYANS